MMFFLEKIVKVLPVLADLSLHFISIGKAGDMENKLKEVKKLIKDGNIKELGKALVDITTFMDEVLHSKAVRNIPPQLRLRYDTFMAELTKKDEFSNPLDWNAQELHDNVIVFISTIEDENERIEAVTELAECKTMDEFKTLIFARGYDKASTPVRQKLQSFYKKMRKVSTAAIGLAGEGVKKAAKDLSTTTSEANQRMSKNLQTSGLVAWSERLLAKSKK